VVFSIADNRVATAAEARVRSRQPSEICRNGLRLGRLVPPGVRAEPSPGASQTRYVYGQ